MMNRIKWIAYGIIAVICLCGLWTIGGLEDDDSDR